MIILGHNSTILFENTLGVFTSGSDVIANVNSKTLITLYKYSTAEQAEVAHKMFQQALMQDKSYFEMPSPARVSLFIGHDKSSLHASNGKKTKRRGGS